MRGHDEEHILKVLRQKYEVKETADSNEVRICCPSPKCSDGNFHLYISLSAHWAFCHLCNTTFLLHQLLNKSIKQLGNQFDAKMVPKQSTCYKFELPPNMIRATSNKDAMQYLVTRNLSRADVIKYKFGYCKEGRFAHRIIIPISCLGTDVGFIARTITEARPKYLYSKGFRKAKALYNFAPAKRHYGQIVLVEGIFDVIRVGDSAVALLGSFLSSGQRDLLLKFLPEDALVVVMLDEDAGSKALDIAERLEPYFDGIRVALLDKGDPSDYSSDELFSVIRKADDYSLSLYKKVLS